MESTVHVRSTNKLLDVSLIQSLQFNWIYMNKNITGIILLSISSFASAELTISSEVLVGNSKHNVDSSLQNADSKKNFASSLSSDSFAFRVGINFTENFSFELAKHDHGKVVNNVEVSIPTIISTPSGPVYLAPEFDTIYEAKIPIDIESLRVGVKGKIELFTNVYINARLGFAHWEYREFTPQKLTNVDLLGASGESGNDLYYSLGTEYKFTENFYVGLEYSLLTINEKTGDKSLTSGSYKHDIKDLSLVMGWLF